MPGGGFGFESKNVVYELYVEGLPGAVGLLGLQREGLRYCVSSLVVQKNESWGESAYNQGFGLL